MIPTPEQAYALVCDYNEGEFHRKHARIVGDVMRWYANELGYGAEADFWQTVGILHDLDFEQWPEQHCTKEQELMREKGIDERIIHATASHGWNLTVDIKPEHEMEKVLYAADELTGLIGACAIMLPSKTMIKTVALEKIFRTEEVETLALNKVSIEVKEGEFVAIMGPSGCGKSTLLNILGLLDNPTSGEYYLNGIEVSRYTEAQRTKLRKGIIGFVFQSFNLIDELNVYENIELPLLYMGVSAAERKKKVQEAMERMAIVHREKHFPQQLSGGQQQRVAIARAVVANPKLILADEPTGNLDSKNGQEVMNLLSELNKEGTTIVMVTHSQHDAGFASRTINLFDGQVVTETLI